MSRSSTLLLFPSDKWYLKYYRKKWLLFGSLYSYAWAFLLVTMANIKLIKLNFSLMFQDIFYGGYTRIFMKRNCNDSRWSRANLMKDQNLLLTCVQTHQITNRRIWIKPFDVEMVSDLCLIHIVFYSQNSSISLNHVTYKIMIKFKIECFPFSIDKSSTIILRNLIRMHFSNSLILIRKIPTDSFTLHQFVFFNRINWINR